jgi:ribosomal protein S27AE
MCDKHELQNAPSDVGEAILANVNGKLFFTPNKCPACGGTAVTETLYSWLCADCGATKESPVRR